MELSEIDIFKINRILDKGITDDTLAKRMWKAKKDKDWHEYLLLCIVKAKLSYDKRGS